jgi:hypothetical protein
MIAAMLCVLAPHFSRLWQIAEWLAGEDGSGECMIVFDEVWRGAWQRVGLLVRGKCRRFCTEGRVGADSMRCSSNAMAFHQWVSV